MGRNKIAGTILVHRFQNQIGYTPSVKLFFLQVRHIADTVNTVDDLISDLIHCILPFLPAGALPAANQQPVSSRYILYAFPTSALS